MVIADRSPIKRSWFYIWQGGDESPVLYYVLRCSLKYGDSNASKEFSLQPTFSMNMSKEPVTRMSYDVMLQNWREVKRGSADVMTFDVDANGVEAGVSLSMEGMITGDEIFNRCINATLEAQEVRHIPYTARWAMTHRRM